MATVKDWNGRDITVVRSHGGVMALADYADNLIRDEAIPWPPPAVVQKLYESHHGSRAFRDSRRQILTRILGVYTDLQSIHSEDAITWNFFGVLATAPEFTRVEFLNCCRTRECAEF